MSRAFIRGEVYAAKFPHLDEEKYWVVVSNNARNRGLEDALVARVTSTIPKGHPSWAVLPQNECVYGAVVCDDILLMYPDDSPRRIGALSPRAMAAVDAGLKAAFGLS